LAKRKKKAMPMPSIATKVVHNPLYQRAHHGERSNPKFITAAINPRESGIVTLVARGLLDEAQEEAADRFRGLWETLGGSGAKALDYSKEPVDGGGRSEPISIRLLAAGRDMKEVNDALRSEHGQYACRLVERIAGEGHSIYDLTQTRRQRDTMTDNLRTYLSFLAHFWGYSNSAQPSQRDVQKRV
jgi:hypothetical protein